MAIKSDGKDYSKVDFGENVGDDIGLFHGGGPGTWEGVEGLKQLLDFPEDYIYGPKINHNRDLDISHLRVHNRAEVATEVKMPDETSEYWLQPLIKLETNTLKFEEMTNEILFGKDRDNTRFYYHKNFEQGVIKFKSFEEKKNFFDMYGVD